MVDEIRIYLEGGGDQANGKALFRKCFNCFLKEIKQIAQQQKIRWKIIPCGSRTNTFEDFCLALKTHPNALNVLLVDSESLVTTASPWQHLQLREGWNYQGIKLKD